MTQAVISATRVIAIEKRNCAAFVEAMFACWQAGEIAMPLDFDADLPDGLVIERRVACSPGGGWLHPAMTPRHDDAPAQITLTSGTTGRPKPIMLSHRALGDVTDRLVAVQRLDSSVREYIGVPVTYSFGLGRVRAVAAVGGACFLPERGFRVDELAAMLRRGEVNALSAVPTLLRLAIAQRDRLAEVGDRLRWLEIGSQAMSVAEKRAVREIFPNARIIQHYGMTEASRTTFLAIDTDDEAHLASVGKPNGTVDVRIVEGGLIAIRGPHVASGIVTPEEVEPLTDAEGWLVTRDLGHLDHAGRLVFEGRADHLINVGGIKVPAELFEERLLAAFGPDALVAVGAGADPLRGELVVVAHEGEAHPTWRALAEEVAGEFGIGDGVALLPVTIIPRTQTGKVRRQDITRLFADAGGRPEPAGTPMPDIIGGDPVEGVIAMFVAVFGEPGREQSATFHSLGGDSLNYVSMLSGLEQFLPSLPEDWDTMSVGALGALAAQQASDGVSHANVPQRVLPRSIDSVRGLACILIVALHVVGVSPDGGLKLPAGSAWHDAMSQLDLVRLPLFTALSGYLYGAMPAARIGFGPFMTRKLRQLLVPLLFATLVFWSLRNATYSHDESLFWAYVDGYQHLWFIDALLLIFTVVASADMLAPARARTAMTVGLMLTAAIAYPLIPSIPVLHIKNAVFLLPFFTMGMLLYRVPALLRSRTLLVGATLVALLLLASQQFSPGADGLLGQYRWLRWVCGGATVIALLQLFPRIGWLERIAAYSFTIYLWHPAANGAVREMLIKLGLQAIWPLFLIGLAVGVLVPIGIHLVAQRLPKMISLPVIGR